VAQLPLQCRRAFLLKKVYGLSQKEIAGYLGISESTVEKHVAKGLLHCATRIREIDSGTGIARHRSRSGNHG
jgi:RNA polymerase sigma-70 factor (ECF subfamily)